MKKRHGLGLVLIAVLCCMTALSAFGEGTALKPQALTEPERRVIFEQVKRMPGLQDQELLGKMEQRIRALDPGGFGMGDVPEVLQQWKEMNEELIRSNLSEDVRLLSQSPDGRCWFGVAGSVPFHYDAAAGEAKAILIDPFGGEQNRTVGITPLLRMYQTAPEALYDAASFHWSPDGRYLSFTFWPAVMRMMNKQDLYVVDTEESVIRISRAFEGVSLNQGSSSIIQACFSADGQTLYHTVYGGLDEGRLTVWAQDVAGGSYACIASAENGDRSGWLPQLALLPGGGLLQVMDSARRAAPRGLFMYAPGETGVWTRAEYGLPATAFLPWKITCGPNGGKGLLHFRAYASAFEFAFSVFDAADGFSGMDELLVLRGFEAQTAEPLPLGEAMDHEGRVGPLVLDAYPSSLFQPDGGPSTPEKPALYCIAAAIAPEGGRALLLLMNPPDGEMGFMGLDLDTLEAECIGFPWDDGMRGDVMAALVRDQLGLHWAANDQLSLSLRGNTVPLRWE